MDDYSFHTRLINIDNQCKEVDFYCSQIKKKKEKDSSIFSNYYEY